MKNLLGILTILVGLTYSYQSKASSYELVDFRDASTAARVLAVNIYGADAKAMYNFIKMQSPQLYTVSKSVSGSTTYIFEHIRGSEIFCAQDTRISVSSTGVTSKTVTNRCDIVVSGSGTLAPKLEYIGGYEDPCAGGCGP